MSMSKKTIINSTIFAILMSSPSTSCLFKKEQTLYPSTNKSVEVKITDSKKDFTEKQIQIFNLSKKDIYVYVDCNYRTNSGGGHDRKTTAKKITKDAVKTIGYVPFLSYYPNAEEIAIRWTDSPNLERIEKDKHAEATSLYLKNANWYETQYKNYSDQKVIVINIYENGEYEQPGLNAKGKIKANQIRYVRARTQDGQQERVS